VTQEVRIGDLAVTIDGIDLRDIRWHGQEAVRRIYPVFQDRNWTNRPFRIESQHVEEGSDSVSLVATGSGSFDAEPLRWQVAAEIRADGIDYRFSAEASSPFLRNRLGMCVLHPMTASGSQVRIEHVDGEIEAGRFPVQLSPFQPFVDIRAITHELPDGSEASVRLMGDTYEMEDHRNWTDASFKTYCTPISLPFPVEVATGDRIDHRVEVSFAGGRSTPPVDDASVRIDVHGSVHALPGLGLCLSHEDLARSDEHLSQLADLGLDHLRVDVDAASPEGVPTIVRACEVAGNLGCALHLAVTCADPSELSAFAGLPQQALTPIRSVYVFSSTDKVTPDSWSTSARAALGDSWAHVLLGGGTDLYFTELNREPPDPLAFDVLNFSLNPQVHAFDDRTLIQNTMTQQIVAQDAPRITDPARISVSPISLRPRFNPNATDPESDVSNTDLPSDVDSRQDTYFAANWTAMSVKYLAAADSVDTATYFEAFGWKGITGITGITEPDQPFPVWQVFSTLAGMTHAHGCTSSDPEIVDALIVGNGTNKVALVANWTADERSIRLGSVDDVTVPGHSLTPIPLPSD